MRPRPCLAPLSSSLLCLLLSGLAPLPAVAPAALAQEEADDTIEDPREYAIARQAKRIARHPYFSKVAFDRVSPNDGYVFFVQKNPAAAAGLAQQTAGEMLPWLEELEAFFVERYVTPNDLQRQRGGAPHVIFVLTSAGDYQNYIVNADSACATYIGANYDPFLAALVTFRTNFGLKFRKGQKARQRRHAFVHALQQAHGVSTVRLPGPEWFAEGQATYMSMLPSSMDRPRTDTVEAVVKIDPALLKHTVDLQQRGGLFGASLRSLEQLVSTDRRSAFRKACFEESDDYWQDLWNLSTQCGLFVHFLNEADDGGMRDAFVKYTQLAMTARGSGDAAARAAFGDLDELDRRFWDYVFAEYKKLKPDFVRKKLVVTSVATGTASATGSAGELSTPSFSPKSLALQETDTDALLGVALWDAQQGRLGTAVAQLDALIEHSEGERIVAERRRVSSLLVVRDAYLAHLLESGSKLRLEIDGKKLSAVVTGVEDGVVHLEKNRRGVDELTIEEIDLVELCDLMAREKPKFGDSLARAYAFALAGDERLSKRLKRVDDDGGLARDQESLGRYIALGGVVQHLRTLAATPLEELDADVATTVIEHIAAVAAYAADMTVIGEREKGLRTLARLAHAIHAESRTVGDLLTCEVERLGADRMRLSYDFSSSVQLDDFIRDDDNPPNYRSQLPQLRIPEGQSLCEVRDGQLTVFGEYGLRLPVSFHTPLRVEYVFRFEEGTSSPTSPYFGVMAGMCDDESGSYVTNFNFGGLVAYAPRAGHRVIDDSNVGAFVYPEQDYRLVLSNDGTTVTISINGKDSGSIPCGPIVAGEPLLSFHSDYVIRVDSFSVEGALSANGADHLRAVWIDRQVDQLFGGPSQR